MPDKQYGNINNSEEQAIQSPKVKIHKKETCYQTTTCWKCMMGICIVISCSLITSIILGIILYVNDTFDERNSIDERNTSISDHSRDFKNDNIYKCSNNNPCYFNCSYIKNNLNKEKKECEYNDWMDIWKIVLYIITGVILCSCICSGKKIKY